ncbi:glycoside hydrolase family 5 protein [Amanita muscaria Koide BX008]|uniref:Glycoside hydrolase family 5 protein n=1 Tax=Amanita muscaria (strain Koide BX008) TaxID=946122 RepID=A0A0C2WKZ7_AMAMK|nr:glycoside hydrolase family 5 protein [Amanita muscaria Koide BX008]
MKLPFLLAATAVLSASASRLIHGVNLGSWLVLEPWMLPEGWVAMGGEICSNCQDCINSESAFAKAYPDTVDEKFNEHWSSWFTQSDVDQLVAAGINTVRIPLGWWIVEPLVDRSKEYFPRGGFRQLSRGLKQLKDAGIDVILDHHALPGIQVAGQEFTGLCTTDVEFYTPYNYHRALVWTAVMTTFSHLLPEFCNVVAIEAVNEPIMDASKTPDYGVFQKNFVEVVRAVEFSLGIPVSGINSPGPPSDQGVFGALNFTLTVQNTFNSEVISALKDSISVIVEMSITYGLSGLSGLFPTASRTPLNTAFMDVNWQYNNPSNPADAAIGPQIYDNHLYYSFGGVADANPTAYLKSMCNLQRVQTDAAMRNSPLVFGEWSLATQFEATDDFLRQWADAQKMTYSKGAGWIFWSFKIENSPTASNFTRVWSYFEGLSRGYLTKDPSAYFNPNVCDGY